jgi:hypothetical protein
MNKDQKNFFHHEKQGSRRKSGFNFGLAQSRKGRKENLQVTEKVLLPSLRAKRSNPGV